LIGATTENPYFEVNSALLSRSQIYELRALEPGDVETLLRRALTDERGITDPPPISDAALEMLAARSGGDARVALSGLERAVERAGGGEIDIAAVEDALQRKALDYDREGDRHYDYISAWIKATRGSDPDASLYYLAVMLEGGEDPRFIVRRMVILASEDIGNADPQALVVATAAGQAVDRVGMPECALNLAQAAAYLALAPKSNASTTAIAAAMAEVREHGAKPPPDYLRDAHYPGAKKLGRGVGYSYPHDEPGGVSDQRLMPEGMEERRFYKPTDRGFEAELRRRLEQIRRRLSEAE
jgi:putative ATPase